MKCVVLLIVFLFAPVVRGQDRPKRIGAIEFYGYAGLDLDKVRATIPVHEGDSFTTSDETFFETLNRIKKEIKQMTGNPPTDQSRSFQLAHQSRYHLATELFLLP